MVLETKYGSPKIVNDGVTIAREVRRTANLVGHQQAWADSADQAGGGAWY